MQISVIEPGHVRPTRQQPPVVYIAIVLLLCILLIPSLLIPALRSPHFGIAHNADGTAGWTLDVASHFAFARAFWTGHAHYDVASYLDVTSAAFGSPVTRALPFVYSPTMLWILAPFCILPPAWAYVAWTVLGLLAVCLVARGPRPTWLLALLFTPASFVCLRFGPTAMLSTAAVLFLAMRKSERPWINAIVLWALTARPPLALAVAVPLLASRKREWPVVLRALGLTVCTSLALTPWLGLNWPIQYFALLGHFDQVTGNPAIIWSLKPETMGNLRALLSVTFAWNDHVAVQLCGALFVAALSALVLVGIDSAGGWMLALLAYALLCPHVNATEELHLLAFVPLMAFFGGSRSRWAVFGLILLILYLPATGFGYEGEWRIPLVVASKLMLSMLVLGSAWRRHSVSLLDRVDDAEAVGLAGTAV